ncbi:TPA_asm: L [Chrysanthemum trirhavirus 1]|nr:TPA_asm: L [Chrysanthemum trirhavirus 1]
MDSCDLYDEFVEEFYDDDEACSEYVFVDTKSKSLRPYHLNSALTPHWLDELRLGRGDRKIRNNWVRITSLVESDIKRVIWQPGQTYIFLSALCICLDPLDFSNDALEVMRCIDQAEQVTWQGSTEVTNRLVMEGLTESQNTPYYRSYYQQSNFFSSIVLLMNAMASGRHLPQMSSRIINRGQNCWMVELADRVSVYITDSLMLIKDNLSARDLIMNYDSVLMCADIAKQRRLVMMMTYVGHKIYPEHYPPQSRLAELFQIIDDGISAFGNNFYKVVKVFEPLCVGAIMRTRTDHFVDNKEFYDTIFNSLDEEEPQFGYHTAQLTAFLTSETNPSWLAQYFGLYRIWGHPIVDVVAGLKKVMDVGLPMTNVNDHVAREAERHFKYILLKNYKSKHHEYPNYRVTGKQDCFLFQSLNSNKDLPVPGDKWMMHELDYLEFTETFKPPATFNLTSIIADKAVSPSRRDLIEILKSGKNQDPSVRRGVLKWLKMEEVSCKEILKMVNNNEFPDDWCIIGVYPKEREMNIKPRLFALMSFELRLYVVVTEEMLSDHILSYFPQITMTHSQLELTKSVFTATRHQSTDYSRKSSNIVTISISMDFEKWNIKMRKEATQYVFNQLGQLFGLDNLYTATHDILSRCFIYLADGSYSPDTSLTPDFIKSWIGHLGGFEGLRQKGWTIFTACLIDYVCSKKDVSFKLMGQGDNQVVQLMFRLNHTSKGSNEFDPRDCKRIRTVTESLLKDLEETFNSVGMTLKISETWKSSHLFSYGKNMVFDGVPLPLSLKKQARAFYESNEGIMVVDSMLATVNTNCQAAAYQDLSHHLAYAISRFECYVMCRKLIHYHPLLGGGLGQYVGKPWKARNIHYPAPDVIPSNKILAALMIIVPRMLGGYNTTCFFEYIMRGFPDPLTRDLRYMKLILQGLKGSSSDLSKDIFNHLVNWYIIHPNPTIDKTFLIQDPVGLNVLSPRSPMDAMRDAVQNILQSASVQNKPFLELIRMKNDGNLENLADLLWTSERLNARLFHDIYQATAYGYITQSVSRIENTNTVKHIAMQKSSKDIVDVIGSSEVNKFLFFIWKSCQFVDDAEDYLRGCTRVYAQNLRDLTWGKEIVGVTVPFPDEYLEMIYEADKITEESEGYFVAGFNEHSVKSLHHMTSQLGPSPPYLGSVTREKTKQTADMSVFKAESLIRRPLKLQRTIEWFIPKESNTARLIRETLSSVCDLNPDDFRSSDWESTGSHIHRYHDSATKKGVLINYSYLPGTHMYLSTDLLVKHAMSRSNVNIVYQACLVYEQYLAWIKQLERMRRNYPPIRILCWKIVCDCVIEVDEGFDDIAPYEGSILKSQEGNSLLWIEKKDLVIHHSKRLTDRQLEEPLDTSSLGPNVTEELFHSSIGKRIAQDVYNGEISENTEARMVDSAFRFPRVYYSKLHITKVVMYFWLWMKVFMMKRLGKVGLDIKFLMSLDSDTMSRINNANPICFQGVGLFFTNREFCESFLQLPHMPKPNTYPYTLRSVGLAAKETVMLLLRKIDKILPTLRNIDHYPVEFSNLRDEIINILYLRQFLKRDGCCIRCIKEISLLSSRSPYKKLCDDHVFSPDLIFAGVLRLAYYPTTVDRLSKEATRLMYRPMLSRCHPIDHIPGVRHIIHDIKRSSRTGQDTDGSHVEDEELPKMGSTWQKYCRAAAFPTASRYKWSCILNKLREDIMPKDFLIFGDGLGGISDIVNIMFPESNITIMSFMDVSDAINHSTIGCIPPEYKGDMSKIDVYYQANRINNVISGAFKEDWRSSTRQFTICISDVELPRDTSPSEKILSLENLCSLGTPLMIAKVYFDTTRYAINSLAVAAQYFDSINVITCSTANLHFNEVFLFCSARKPIPTRWSFSANALSHKLYATFQLNHQETWNTFGDSLTLEKAGWIVPELEKGKIHLFNWMKRFELDRVLFHQSLDTNDLIRTVNKQITKYHKRTYGTKKKVPYFTLLQMAHRIIAILLIHGDDIEEIHYYMENPDTIKLMISNDPGEEKIEYKFTRIKDSNQENWSYTLRYVAIGRRMLKKQL